MIKQRAYLAFAYIPLGAVPVYVSRALQKAKIVVDEDGTKAAAATSECLRFLVSSMKKKIHLCTQQIWPHFC